MNNRRAAARALRTCLASGYLLPLLAAHASAQRPDPVPPVDRSKHNVPLEEVYFDTFRRTEDRAVALPDATPELIERLLDAIPPLHYPRYEPAGQAGWLDDDDAVIGYVAGQRAWAFPIRILNLHEIVNDTLGGEPVLVSYCPLCRSGIVYSRRLDGRVITFGNTSALYESDMVMLDYDTGSYWWQVAGEAIVGALTGSKLTVLPASNARWGDWRRTHPETMVLSRETGHDRNYDRNPYTDLADRVNRGLFSFPLSPKGRDQRLEAGSTVLAVRYGGQVRAYRLDGGERAALMDRLGGNEVVVLTNGVGGGAAFVPVARGRALRFRVRGGEIRDRETDSVWNLAGTAVSGPMRGERLEQLATKTSFWFAIVASEPEITVYH